MMGVAPHAMRCSSRAGTRSITASAPQAPGFTQIPSENGRMLTLAERTNQGVVYLVGAGPGDPGLLTVRGQKLLEQADVVVYDYLANPELLNHCRSDVERVYVGKQAAAHSMSQEDINALLVARGRDGKRVVRLKGGDPFV